MCEGGLPAAVVTNGNRDWIGRKGRHNMQKRLIDTFLILAAALTTMPVSFAQAPGAQTSGQLKPTTKSPGAAPDLTGVWMIPQRSNTLVVKEEIPLQPWAAAKSKSLRHDKDDPNLLCLPPGVPRILLNPSPMEILQVPGRIVILHENDHLVRQIWMDGRGHPSDLFPTWMGHSIGKWEGDTLVIDTIGLNDKTWLDSDAHPHTEAMRVTERVRRTDHDTLQFDVTIDDPKAYTKPWTGQKIFKLQSGWQIMEHVCEDNEVTQKALAGGGGSQYDAPGGEK